MSDLNPVKCSYCGTKRSEGYQCKSCGATKSIPIDPPPPPGPRKVAALYSQWGGPR